MTKLDQNRLSFRFSKKTLKIKVYNDETRSELIMFILSSIGMQPWSPTHWHAENLNKTHTSLHTDQALVTRSNPKKEKCNFGGRQSIPPFHVQTNLPFISPITIFHDFSCFFFFFHYQPFCLLDLYFHVFKTKF